jgi:hypothetical protein
MLRAMSLLRSLAIGWHQDYKDAAPLGLNQRPCAAQFRIAAPGDGRARRPLANFQFSIFNSQLASAV